MFGVKITKAVNGYIVNIISILSTTTEVFTTFDGAVDRIRRYFNEA